MQIILITTIVITVIGIIVAAALVFVSNRFHVEADERVTAIREALPGNNCGACGYAGCDAMSEAIASGEAPVNACPVGGAPVADRIAEIMGVETMETERYVAFVKCRGNCDVMKRQGNYVGINDCRVAVHAGIQVPSCDWGCYGLGSCVTVCPHDAIHVVNGVAQVNESRCVGCAMCVKTCPKKLIELVPAKNRVRVQCSSRERGPVVRKVCSAGCIGCAMCVRECPAGAVSVTDNLAQVDYERCVQCGACADKCPAGVITVPQNIPDRKV